MVSLQLYGMKGYKIIGVTIYVFVKNLLWVF
jgi:hypothetical protein